MAATSAGRSEQCWISGSLLGLGFCGIVVKINITSISWAFEMAQWVKVLSKLQSFLGTLVKVERKSGSTKLSSDLSMSVPDLHHLIMKKLKFIFKVMKCCMLFLRT